MDRIANPLMLAILALAAGAARADTAPPAGDGACRVALERLHTQEEAQRSARRQQRDAPAGVSRALESARRLAARDCLGSESSPPAASRQRAQPPLAVAPVQVPAPFASLPPPAAPTGPRPSAASPVQRPGLSTVTHCDSAGCWTSDGQYLMRTGPGNLAGTPGLCTTQAGILTCH